MHRAAHRVLQKEKRKWAGGSYIGPRELRVKSCMDKVMFQINFKELGKKVGKDILGIGKSMTKKGRKHHQNGQNPLLLSSPVPSSPKWENTEAQGG